MKDNSLSGKANILPWMRYLILSLFFLSCLRAMDFTPTPLVNLISATTPVQAAANRRHGRWLLQHMVEAYKKEGIRDPKWDAAHERLFHGAALWIANLRSATMPKQLVLDSDQWKEKGKNISRDPLFHAVRFMLYDAEVVPKDANHWPGYACDAGTDAFRKTQIDGIYRYHPIFSFILQRYMIWTWRSGANDGQDYAQPRKDIQEEIDRFIQLAFLLASNRDTEGAENWLLGRIEIDWLPPTDADLYNQALIEGSKIGPQSWYTSAIRAVANWNLAYTARGTDWGSTVTNTGWKKFHAFGNDSAREALSAWKENPRNSFSPSLLMRLGYSGASDILESPRLWFERGVQVTFDQYNLYSNTIHFLRPRWGGSYEQIRDFGLECLETLRYDTFVPGFYLNCLHAIHEDAVNMDNVSQAKRILADKKTLLGLKYWVDTASIAPGFTAEYRQSLWEYYAGYLMLCDQQELAIAVLKEHSSIISVDRMKGIGLDINACITAQEKAGILTTEQVASMRGKGKKKNR